MKKFNIWLMGFVFLGILAAPAITRAQVETKFKIGDFGQYVKELQEKLRASGDFTYPQITGYYGKITDEAVKKYEARTKEKILRPIPRPLPVPPVGNMPITVISPNGGERDWQTGAVRQINWTLGGGFSLGVYTVDINWVPAVIPMIYCAQEDDSRCDFSKKIVSGVPMTSYVGAGFSGNGGGSYNWKVGTFEDGSNFATNSDFEGRIRVCLSGTKTCDYSDSHFTISSNNTIPYPQPVGNQPPVIHGVSGPTLLKVGEMGEWSVKASDPENGSLKYAIDWGDRNASAGAAGLPMMSGLTYDTTQNSTFTHSYSSAGTYTVTFAVSDNLGSVNKSSMSVQVGGSDIPRDIIQVLSPNGGERWLVGSTQSVQWRWSGPSNPHYPQYKSTNLNIYLLGEYGSKRPLVQGVDSRNGGGFSVKVPSWAPAGNYRVGVCDDYLSDATEACDYSDSYFKIYSDDTSDPMPYTPSVKVSVENEVQYGVNKNEAFISTSIGAGSQNKSVYSWELTINCPDGVTLTVPSKTDGPGKEMCRSATKYYTYNYYDITQGPLVLTAGAVNKNSTDSYVGFTLNAYDANGNALGGDKDSVVLGGTLGDIIDENSNGAASVKVVSSTGKTVTGAKVSLHTMNGRLVGTDNTSGGFALFENLPDGSYLAYAKADGYAPARAKVTISEKKPKASVTIKLKKEKTVPPPKVVTAGIVSSNPPDGAIDARMPSNVNGSSFWQGWNQFVFRLEGVASTDLAVNSFALKSTGGVSTPINNVAVDEDGLVTLTTQYGVPIPEGERTVIKHEPTGTEICLGYLPGDVDGSGKVDGADLLTLIDAINGVKNLPSYSTDLNRDGLTNSEDQLTWIDLTNGADAYSAWFGESLPSCPRV